jgi:nicotinamidase-related amidase
MQALIVIDVQKEYSPSGALPVARFDDVVKRVSSLLEVARTSPDTKVIHVRHISRKHNDSSFGVGSSGLKIEESVEPREDEFLLTKHYPGAFTNPELDRYLIRNGVDTVFICGFTSILCCDQTAREAFQLGYNVYYIEDAISEFGLGDLSPETLHNVINAIQGAMYSNVIDAEHARKLLSS